MSDDLEALFGTGFLESEVRPKRSNDIIKKDVSEYTDIDLRNKFIEESEEIIQHSKDAVIAALEQATMAPGEGESVAAIASLVNAHARLLENINKMYTLQEKHRQAKELVEMRNNAQSKMNTENNMTKITMTREMVMAELMKSRSDKIIDAEN